MEFFVRGHAVGQLTLIGSGAGKLPTASAVVGDLMNLAGALKPPDFASYFQPTIEASPASASPPDAWKCPFPFYLRLVVKDTLWRHRQSGHLYSVRTI